MLNAPCSVGFHELLELRPLACNQELGRSIIQALALQLPDRGAELEDFGAQS